MSTKQDIPRDIAARIEQEAKEYSQKVNDQIGDKKHMRIKTIAYYAYKDAAEKYIARIQAAEEQMERMAKVLEYLMICDDLERHMTISAMLTDYNTYKQQKDGTVNG